MINATKLDLACGERKESGYFGIDRVQTSCSDYVLDLTSENWPIADNSIESIVCNHFFEHMTGDQRIKFMDECYRVMKPNAQMGIIVPYWNTVGAIQDPTHQWPPVCEESFLYFNASWRDYAKLAHYGIKCNFGFEHRFIYYDATAIVKGLDVRLTKL